MRMVTTVLWGGKNCSNLQKEVKRREKNKGEWYPSAKEDRWNYKE